MFIALLAACSENAIQVRNTPPDVVIVDPGDNSIAVAGTPTTFTAQVSDAESSDEDLRLYWQRSDGIPVDGAMVFANGLARLTLQEGLPSGTQAITLLVTDPGAESGEDTVFLNVRVNQPPALQLISPEAGSTYAIGAPVVIAGAVMDPDGAFDDIDLSWTSDLDLSAAPVQPALSGVIVYTITDAPLGDHQVTLTASDLYGAESTVEIRFEVSFQDADDDGFSSDEDCDDDNGDIYPGVTEVLNDAVDQNCDGKEACLTDSDGDEHATLDSRPTLSDDLDCDDAGEATLAAERDDCNDLNAGIYPGATELLSDGVDQDCDSFERCWTDGDGDNYRPLAPEDSGTASSDLDCDDPGEASHVTVTGDCADDDPRFHPGAEESDCTDPNDYNCDDIVAYANADGDAYAACEDCDDAQSSVFPGAPERVADGVDQSCDGKEACYLDADADRHRPNPTSLVVSADLDCTDPGEATASVPTDDCNDLLASVYPSAAETPADGVDQDCDGRETCFADMDLDGYRALGDAGLVSLDLDCSDAGEAEATLPGPDCDDHDSAVHPGAIELCNGTDDDCSASTSDGDADPDVGAPCDGIDADTCEEGYLDCDGGDLTCNDLTGNAPCDPESGPRGDAAFTTPGAFSFTVPVGVTSISAVAIGAGGICGQSLYGGGGGALSYRNNVPVTPGETLVITVGAGGSWTQSASTVWSGTASTVLGMTARGGVGGNTTGAGGSATGGDANFSGGSGGYSTYPHSGGGGAAGYTEAGRNGLNGSVVGATYIAAAGGAAGNAGLSGGTGSAPTSSYHGGSGGGTEMYGTSAGIPGANGTSISAMGQGGKYGGGAGCGGNGYAGTPSTGGSGAVRLVWPGNSRTFPSTNLTD